MCVCVFFFLVSFHIIMIYILLKITMKFYFLIFAKLCVLGFILFWHEFSHCNDNRKKNKQINKTTLISNYNLVHYICSECVCVGYACVKVHEEKILWSMKLLDLVV